MPRKRLDKVSLQGKVDRKSWDDLAAIAIYCGFTYGDGAAIGAFLEALSECSAIDLKKILDERLTE